MKKLSLLIVSLVVCIATVFSLASCTIEGEGTTTINADNKKDSLELLNSFFDTTIENGNFKVTTKADGRVISVESIDGEKTHTDFKTTGAQTYAFKQGETYYMATATEDGGYYMTGKEYYDQYHYNFKNSFAMLDMIPEEGEDAGTFTCVSEIKSKDKISESEAQTDSTATLTFEVTGEGGSITIVATAENDLVKTVTVTRKEQETEFVSEMTFEYGNVSVTVPDITEWADMTDSGNPEEGGEIPEGGEGEEENIEDPNLGE